MTENDAPVEKILIPSGQSSQPGHHFIEEAHATDLNFLTFFGEVVSQRADARATEPFKGNPRANCAAESIECG